MLSSFDTQKKNKKQKKKDIGIETWISVVADVAT